MPSHARLPAADHQNLRHGFGPLTLVALVAAENAASAASVPATFSVVAIGSDVASFASLTCRPEYAVHSGRALAAATGFALQTILSDAVLASAGRLDARTPSART